MEEPKNPCGCGGSTQTRREFLQKAAVVGAGLSVAAIGLTAPTAARASTFDLSTCLGIAHDNYEQCKAGAQEPRGSGVAQRAQRFAKQAACDGAFAAAKANCYALLAGEVAEELAQHITGQPQQSATTVVVAGVILIIGAGFVFAF